MSTQVVVSKLLNVPVYRFLLHFTGVVVLGAAFYSIQKTGAWDLTFLFYGFIFLFSLRVRKRVLAKSVALIFACNWMIAVTLVSGTMGLIPLKQVPIIANAAVLAIPFFLVPRRALLPYLEAYLPRAIRVALLAAAIKYTISQVFNLNDRPFLFHENNFEIPFFIFLVMARNREFKLNFDFFLLFIIVGMSGSLSGMVALVMYILLASFAFRKLAAITFLMSLMILMPPAQQLLNRIAGIVEEERVEWIVGYVQATERQDDNPVSLVKLPSALPPEFCTEVERWSSDSDISSCYSNTLHGTTIRLLVDFGLIPAFFFMVGYGRLMCVIFGLRRGTIVTALLVSNGLSVSGFANEIAIAGVALLYCSEFINKGGGVGRLNSLSKGVEKLVRPYNGR